MPKIRNDKAEAFREKLSKLTFLDPACGSGNFLTETYISLRRLENEALELVTGGQMLLDFGDVIKVSIGQFYGVEINDFAVTVKDSSLDCGVANDEGNRGDYEYKPRFSPAEILC